MSDPQPQAQSAGQIVSPGALDRMDREIGRLFRTLTEREIALEAANNQAQIIRENVEKLKAHYESELAKLRAAPPEVAQVEPDAPVARIVPPEPAEPGV